MPDSPQKAVILAAGLGTRLRPLTWLRPKPLMPLWGEPLILRMAAMLERWGVREILVNLHWQAAQVRACLEARSGAARCTFFHEIEILGTGGALRAMRSELQDAPFWVVNADIAASVAPEPLLAAFARRKRRVAATWLDPRKGPRTVETARNGRICSYRSKRPGAAGTATFCGVQVVSPKIFDFLPSRPFCTLVELYEAAAADGWDVAGVRVPGSYWDDAGTIDAYLRIHEEVRRRARRGQPGGELYEQAGNAGVPPAKQTNGTYPAGGTPAPQCAPAGGTPALPGKIQRCVIWPGARLEPRASLRRVVVADDCAVGGAWRDTALIPATAAPDAALTQVVAQLGWPVEETALSFLGARGSNRSFWRAGFGKRRAVLVRYSLERPENGRYAGHARLLAKAGVPVPRLLAELPEAQVLALEDWGSTDLRKLLARRPADVDALYEPVLAAAARLHTEVTSFVVQASRLPDTDAAGTAAPLSVTALEPPFDLALYQWEHALFCEQLLAKRYGVTTLPNGVAEELARTAQRLLAAPVVVVHRDFQSSNVLCRRGRIALIDFQGMRLGAAAYDLASLLCDPYVQLPAETRLRLLARYAALCPAQGASATALFPWAAVQRLTQALGAFGRLTALGHRDFAAHIAPAAATLGGMAATCGLTALAGLAREIATREGHP